MKRKSIAEQFKSMNESTDTAVTEAVDLTSMLKKAEAWFEEYASDKFYGGASGISGIITPELNDMQLSEIMDLMEANIGESIEIDPQEWPKFHEAVRIDISRAEMYIAGLPITVRNREYLNTFPMVLTLGGKEVLSIAMRGAPGKLVPSEGRATLKNVNGTLHNDSISFWLRR